MKRLTCEMCNSNDLVKIDGLFVCQYCGTKYSIEEAKKMMFDGPVDVKGTVNIGNIAQASNLLKMAHNAYDSKNYSKAEEFCDQVLAINDLDSDAWLLKGRAISHLNSSDNPRIIEACNCVIASYTVLDESKKTKSKESLWALVKEYLEYNIASLVLSIETGDPTKYKTDSLETCFTESRDILKTAINKLDLNDSSDKRLNQFDNEFIISAELAVQKCWQNSVSYKYFRNSYDHKKEKWIGDAYRPDTSIFLTYVAEIDQLIEILRFCAKYVNKTTPLEKYRAIYTNTIFFNEAAMKSQAFSRTEQNALRYGLVNSLIKWTYVSSITPTDRANRALAVASDKKVIEFIDGLVAEQKEKIIQTHEQVEREATKKRIADYWAEHPQERANLENEKASLYDSINRLRQAIDTQPGKAEQRAVRERINNLSIEKNALTADRVRERKAIQYQIDLSYRDLQAVTDKVNRITAELQRNISTLESRINSINSELAKER